MAGKIKVCKILCFLESIENVRLSFLRGRKIVLNVKKKNEKLKLKKVSAQCFEELSESIRAGV